MVRRHVVISGTGRAGTTFLVELFTHLGLDTGFTPHDLAEYKDATAQAGLEHDLRKATAPYVVKSPHFCDFAEEILARGDVRIERVIIPMRDLYAAAESRRRVYALALSKESLFERVMAPFRKHRHPGGLWHTRKGHDQELILLQQLYKLNLAISASDVPVTLLRYPRLVKDSTYLHMKLLPILPGIGRDEFADAFKRTVDPSLVHCFAPADV